MTLPQTYGCCVALRSAHHLKLPKGSRVVYAVAHDARCRLRWLGPITVAGPDSRKRLAKKLNQLAGSRKRPIAIALVGKPCDNCGDDRVMRRSQMRCHPKTNLITETIVLVRKDSELQPEFEQIRGSGYRLRPIEEWDRTPAPKKAKTNPIAVELKLALRYCNDEARAHVQAALQLLNRRRKKRGTHDNAHPQEQQQGQEQGQRQEGTEGAQGAQGPQAEPVRQARWWHRD